VPEVRRPPFLGVGHQGGEIFLYSRQVKALELPRIIEAPSHRTGLPAMLVQEIHPQLIRPPLAVCPAGRGMMVKGTLALWGICGGRVVWHG